MRREIAKMSIPQLKEWMHDREAEATYAYYNNLISRPVYSSIMTWIIDTYIDYIAALSLGLIRLEGSDKGGANR